MNLSASRVSSLAIVALWLALIRTLAEYYRLRYIAGAAVTLDQITPYITGALMPALGIGAAGAHVLGQYRLASIVAAITITVMIVYKIEVFGFAL